MKIIIHRGTKEIGGSCVEIGSNTTRIVIDIGLPLVNEKGEKFESRAMRGLGLKQLKDKKILPNVPGLYSKEKTKVKVDALLISHSHLDHYGLYRYIRKDIPVYISEGAKRIIDVSNIFTLARAYIKNYIRVKHKEKITIGDMLITPYLTDHSAFGSFAYLIESGGKRVFYSGDFRGHGRKEKLFKSFLKNPPKNIDCLLLEGTSIGQKKRKLASEEEVEFKIIEAIRSTDNLKLAYFSPQNIDRFVSFYRAVLRTKSLFVVDLYTAYLLEKISHLIKIPKPGANNLKIYYPAQQVRSLIRKGHRQSIVERYREYQIREQDIDRNRKKTIMIFRGSMINDLEKIGHLKDSLLIYSIWEGYLREDSFKAVKQFLKENRIKLETIHTSGHAYVEDLQRFVEALKPKEIIPIHTSKPGEYGIMFKDVKIRLLDDGEVYEIPEEKVKGGERWLKRRMRRRIR